MDAKRLLAEATAEQLRLDAEEVRALGKWFSQVPVALLRLAALAEAVAVMQERCGEGWRLSLGENGCAIVLDNCAIAGHDKTLPAALSTLLPTEDTTDGR